MGRGGITVEVGPGLFLLALLLAGPAPAAVPRPGGGQTPPVDAWVTLLRRVELAEDGPGRAREETRHGGSAGAELRRRLGGGGRDATLAARRRLAAVEESRLELGALPAGRGEGFYAEVALSRWSSTGVDEAEALVPPAPAFELLPPELSAAPEAGAGGTPPVSRVSLPFSFRVEVRYQLLPPAGFHPVELVPPDRFRVGSAAYEATASASPDGQVEVVYRFQAGRQLQPAEARALRAALLARAGDGSRVRFQRTSRALLEASRGREALTELRRLIALHPGEARHRFFLGQALLELGMVEAGRAEVRRGLALEPRSEWGHRLLAVLLEQDVLGRKFAAGTDLAEVVAELRLAAEGEPRLASSRGLLAQTLVTTPGGGLEDPGPRLQEALGLLEDVPPGAGHDVVHARLLLLAGQPHLALVVGGGLPPGLARDGLVLAAAALVDGPPSLRRALKEVEDPPAALRAAMLALWRARAYPAVASLRAAPDLPLPPEVAALPGLAAQVRRWEDLRLDRADPAQLPRLFFRALALDDGSALRELVHPAFPVPSPQARWDLLSRQLEAALGPNEGWFSWKGAAETAVAQLEVTVEPGGPPWRVRVTAPRRGGCCARPFELTQVWVPQPGGPRMLPVDPTPADLALAADALAREGDLPGVRALLGWVRAGLKAEAPARLVLDALWTSGGQAGREELERAVAAMAAGTSRRAAALPVVREARARATGAARTALSSALLQALLAEPSLERRAALAEEVAAEEPTLADLATELRARALASLGRLEQARALAAQVGARVPLVRALRLRARVELLAGNLEAHARLVGQLLELEGAGPADFNSAAWYQLFLPGPVSPRAILQAQWAVDGFPGADPSHLHTLAAVQAASGQLEQAMATLRLAVQARQGALETDDWLVIGSVAEGYGLLEEARAAYRRVEPPADASGVSTWALAQAHLAALEGKAPPPW